MSFDSPAALWGLLGLLIPLAIHLFNAQRGRRLDFGDTRFIDAAQAEQMQNLVPSQWLLLAMRSLLVVLMVLWLAGPQWRPTPDFQGRAAVLISPLALSRASPATRLTANDLAADQGAHLRLLAPGFPRVDALNTVPVATAGAFNRLAALESDLPPSLPVVLLTAADPRESGWRRPVFDREVEAIDIAPGSEGRRTPVRYAIEASDRRRQDAEVLAAALKQPPLAELLQPVVPGQGAATIRFVLGAPPLTGAAALTVRDAVDLPAVDPPDPTTLAFHGRRFPLRVASDDGRGEILLRADNGAALARLVRDPAGATLQWQSRFDPAHAAIVADPLFPVLMAELLAQGLAGFGAGPELVPTEAPSRQPRWPWLPALIGLLWALERWLAYGRKR